MTRDTWAQLPAEPKHKMGALTTYELRNYRDELEQALDDVPEESHDHAVLEQRLAAVTAEQDSRQRPVGRRLRGAKPRLPPTAPAPPPNPCHRPACLITVNGVTFCDEGPDLRQRLCVGS
jgi:hypothetical protein